MPVPVRLLLTLFVFAAVDVLTFWVPFSLLVPDSDPGLATACAFVTAGVAAYGVWRWSGGASRGLASAMAYGALVAGAIGFTAGFVGPLVLTPEANQGPLLGIFITGPGGAILGSLWGLWRWHARSRANQTRDRSVYR